MQFNEDLFDFVNSRSIDEIKKEIVEINKNIEFDNKIGAFVVENGHYQDATVNDFVQDLKVNIAKYKEAYAALFDEHSKNLFLSLLEFRCTLDEKVLGRYVSEKNNMYFEKSLLPKHGDNVYVDCGAKEGQSIKRFIKKYGGYRNIYAYEPLCSNYEQLKKNLKEIPNISISSNAVYTMECDIRFTTTLSSNSNRIDSEGDITVKAVDLDSDITQPVSYIKMDIEGGEIEAIKGSKMHIANDEPQLSICVYHILDDIWKVWDTINLINGNYQYSLRYYGTKIQDRYKPYGIILYAEPKDKVLE